MQLQSYRRNEPTNPDDTPEHVLRFDGGTGDVKLLFSFEREIPIIRVVNGEIVMIGRSGVGPLWRKPSTMKSSDLMTEAERCLDRYGEIMQHLNLDFPSKNFEPLIRFAMDKRKEFRSNDE